MGQPRQDPKAEATAEAAASWFMRLQRPEASADDWRAFEAWLSADPENADAYARLERIWIDVEVDAEALARQLNAPAAGGSGARRTSLGRTPDSAGRRALVGSAMAAGLVAAIAGAMLWPERPQTAVYATRPGETRRITLPDGSKVQLDADSRIEVSFARRVRRVEMADAEAVFDVAHDPRRPFIIRVGDREVKVTGTEFNLRRRDARTLLTVRRGVVEVRTANQPEGPATRVTAGQQLVHRDGEPSAQLSNVTPDAAFAWTTGQLVYRDAPLREVAGDLSRRLGVPIRTADAGTADLRVTGVLVVDRAPAVLRRLEAYAPIKIERRGDGYVLRARPGR